MAKSKKELYKELKELVLDNPEVSHELHTVFIELLNENTPFRKKFGLKAINTKKTQPATIDNPIYCEIVKQLVHGNEITLALDLAAEALNKPKPLVKRFYYETAGGQNEKNQQKTPGQLIQLQKPT